MQAKVIRKFRDKFNLKRIYEIGATFEGSAERVKELENNGWVKAIPEPVKAVEEPAKEEKPKPRRTRAKKSE